MAAPIAFAVALGDQAYAGTGQIGETAGYLDDFWKYDPGTDTWTALADFPGGARSGVSAWSAGGASVCWVRLERYHCGQRPV